MGDAVFLSFHSASYHFYDTTDSLLLDCLIVDDFIELCNRVSRPLSTVFRYPSLSKEIFLWAGIRRRRPSCFIWLLFLVRRPFTHSVAGNTNTIEVGHAHTQTGCPVASMKYDQYMFSIPHTCYRDSQTGKLSIIPTLTFVFHSVIRLYC